MRFPASTPTRSMTWRSKLMAKLQQYPGFLFVNSDLFNHTPNLQVDILRDQAKLYGVSETRILTLLHNAYSQNYSYLIKKPNDQYQVILEVADRPALRSGGSGPALHQERRRAAHGSAERGHQLASGDWAAVGESHQPIHQRHDLFQPEAGLHRSARRRSSSRDREQKFCRRACAARLQGEALTFRDTVSTSTVLMGLPCS